MLFASSILLSIATVYAQVNDVTPHFLKVRQDKVHQQMLDSVAGNPRQYRILADLRVEPLIKLFGKMGIPGAEVSPL